MPVHPLRPAHAGGLRSLSARSQTDLFTRDATGPDPYPNPWGGSVDQAPAPSMLTGLPAHPRADYIPLNAADVTTRGAFSGYASLFNVADMSNDIILPGAFAASLASRGAKGIKLLYQHRASQPIGVWKTLREDARGLYAEGVLSLDNSIARDVMALLKSGAIDGLSIGFRAAQGSRPYKTGPRRLTSVDLWEISIVTFPMLPGARVTAVKTDQPRSRSPTPGSPALDTSTLRLAALSQSIRASI